LRAGVTVPLRDGVVVVLLRDGVVEVPLRDGVPAAAEERDERDGV